MNTIRLLTGNAAWPRLRVSFGKDLRLRTGTGMGAGSFLGNGRSRGNAGTNEQDDGDRVSGARDAM